MKKVRLMTVFCTLAVAAVMTGCGKTASNNQGAAAQKAGSSDISQKIDLVVGGIDRGNSADNKWWPTEIVAQVEKKLNVNLKMVNYDQQKLGLDLASGDLPDVMLIYPLNTDSVLKGKHAVALNKYFDTIGKNLALDRFSFRNGIMAKYRSGGDGNVYFTTPAVTVKGEGEANPSISLGYVVRWDLYKEIGAPEINTPDDYIDAMKKMQQLYPKTADGLPTYAMSMYNDVGLHAWTFHGIMDSDYINLDSNLLYIYNKDNSQVSSNIISDKADTPFWNDMHFYNKMWKEGLLDPDCFITKSEDLTAKYTKGQYLGGINNWYYGTYNQNAMGSSNPTSELVVLPCHDTWQNGYFPAGWVGKQVFVSSHSKNIDRAVMFLDYINSEEFARLQYSGVEGVNWKMGDDKKPALTQETINMKDDPSQSDAWSKIGLNAWTNWGGMGSNSLMSDGYPASLWLTPDMLSKGLNPAEKDMCKTFGVSYPAEYDQKLVKEGKRIDNSTFNNRFQSVMASPTQDVTRIDGNVKEIVINSLPSLVQAKDETAFDAAREKLIADVKAANGEQSVKWWQDATKTALDDVAALNQ